MKQYITKPEVRFWIAIISIIVTSAVAFNTLSMKVEAIYDKGASLRSEYEKSIDRIDARLELLDKMQIDIAEIKKDVQYLKNNR